MYQTVGQDAVDYVGQALDVPLFRRTIKGSAVDQGLEYGPRDAKSSQDGVSGDETEDLYELLSSVIVSVTLRFFDSVHVKFLVAYIGHLPWNPRSVCRCDSFKLSTYASGARVRIVV